MLHRVIHKAVQLSNRLFVDLGDRHETVFLAGTGRSGTTWLQNILNYDNTFRVMFEPFHSRRVNLVSDWNYRQYLREDNGDKQFLEPAQMILEGRIRNEWIDRFNRKRIARRRLIKDIRSNLFLHWIRRHFPEVRMILLLRHPCAVASSKLELGWDTHLTDFLSQEELMSDFLYPFRSEIEAAEDPFAKHVFMWCVENYVPLCQFGRHEILVVFYENLCHNPQTEIAMVLEHVGLPLNQRALDVAALPSAMSRKDSPIRTGTSLVNSWRDRISERQILQAIGILELFGLDSIYDEGTMPKVSGEDALDVVGA